ncbi:MAG: hypothetical protein QNJ42_18830 [Crocosphaera sp.]|nr:hypothetical protein [Crocosphaera sp.]
MINNVINKSSSSNDVSPVQKFLRRNYENNLKTNYTEIIEDIAKNFNYLDHNQYYWSEPELSLFYGTPLHEQCSDEQKLVLNHLFWTLAYRTVADSETEATRYNLLTAGSFTHKSNDYQCISDMLEHETDQEYVHIKAFYKVAYQVYKHTINTGKVSNTKIAENFYTEDSQQSKKIKSILLKLNADYNEQKDLKKAYHENSYVKKLNEAHKVTCTNTHGFFNTLTGDSSMTGPTLFSENWGSSPFLGCCFYLTRYIANLWLKNFEYKISKYHTKLQKQEQFIPDPTYISHYHFLDEAFHTTTSLKLGRDFYKELPQPSEYEKHFTNVYIYIMQTLNLGGFSGIVPNRCIPDSSIIPMVYSLLRSQVFNMSSEEALYWLEQCYCHEHNGYYTNKKYHDQLSIELYRLMDSLDYLWPVNKTMELFKLAGSIEQAIEDNVNSFNAFSHYIKGVEFA